MPNQIPYTVKFPEGDSVTFTAPSDMSDLDVYTRAVQERAIKKGQIPTTFAGGAAPEAADALTNAALTGAGYATGQPGLVAAGPLAGRGARAAAQKVAGQEVSPTNTAEMLTLGGEGALQGFGPGLVADAVSGIAARTLPRQLANGSWIAGLRGHGVVPWAIREGSDAASQIAEKYIRPISPQAIGETVSEVGGDAVNAIRRVMAGVTKDDLALLRAQIGKGMNARTAARIVSGNDPQKASALLQAFYKGIQ